MAQKATQGNLGDSAAVADRLQIPRSTILDRWRAWGLPAYRIGQRLRFDMDELENWIADQRVTDACS